MKLKSNRRTWIGGFSLHFSPVGNLWLVCAAMRLVAAQEIRTDEISDDDVLKHTVIAMPLGQICRYANAVDPISIKWARAAMNNAELAWQLRERLKTPDRKVAEEAAELAMLNPEEFRRRRQAAEFGLTPKTPEQQSAEAEAMQQRQEALRAIRDPIVVGRENSKDAATRRREAIAERAILNPHEFNARVDRHKSAELREKEAEAIRAFSDPEGFLNDRQRLSKGKDSQGGPKDQTKPSHNSPARRPEKGTEGGGQ